MKIKYGFISNSSTSSYIIQLSDTPYNYIHNVITQKQFDKFVIKTYEYVEDLYKYFIDKDTFIEFINDYLTFVKIQDTYVAFVKISYGGDYCSNKGTIMDCIKEFLLKKEFSYYET